MELLAPWIPEIHLAATVFMAGLIVFVQVVHYPLMARVGEAGFTDYESAHTLRTGWVVMPPMVAELGTALWLAGLPPSPGLRPLALAGAGMVGLIWVSTALLQAPAHGRLTRGWDPAVHRLLVRSNWIRTVLWLARVPVAFALLG